VPRLPHAGEDQEVEPDLTPEPQPDLTPEPQPAQPKPALPKRGRRPAAEKPETDA
jgi:hypothetical protein